MSNLFISLFIAAFTSFAALVTLIGCAIALLGIIGYVPGFWELSHQMESQMLDFLAVFGDGNPLQGTVTLGLTISTVAILLDMLNFYRYQSIRDRDILVRQTNLDHKDV